MQRDVQLKTTMGLRPRSFGKRRSSEAPALPQYNFEMLIIYVLWAGLVVILYKRINQADKGMGAGLYVDVKAEGL